MTRLVWNKPGIPHTDWESLYVVDLGAPAWQCDMCDNKPIRYVHYLQHSAYPRVLKVGYVCAAKMTGDPEGTKARELVLRKAARRRIAAEKREETKRFAAEKMRLQAERFQAETRERLENCKYDPADQEIYYIEEEISRTWDLSYSSSPGGIAWEKDMQLQEEEDEEDERLREDQRRADGEHRAETAEIQRKWQAMSPAQRLNIQREEWTYDWQISAKGNHYRHHKGRHFVVFQNRKKCDQWSFQVDGKFARKTYPSRDAAKIAIYDALHGVTV